MRVAACLLSLGFFASVLAAPAPHTPILFAKDPMSVHKRSPEPAPMPMAGSSSSSSSTPAHARVASSSNNVVEVPEESSESEEEACVTVCGIRRVEGAKNEREALCSVDGLKATLDCAVCIDTTWPDTTWEDSAMAEYHRIVDACDDTPVQQVLRSS